MEGCRDIVSKVQWIDFYLSHLHINAAAHFSHLGSVLSAQMFILIYECTLGIHRFNIPGFNYLQMTQKIYDV